MWGFPEDGLTHAEGVAWVRWQRSQLEDPGFDTAELQALCSSPSDLSLALRLKDGRVIERHSQPLLVDG
jgi:hypothetical protein